MQVGYETTFIHDLRETLEVLSEDKVHHIIAPLFHPRFRRDRCNISKNRVGPGTRSDFVVDSTVWTSSVIGKISPWIQLDASVESVQKESEAAFDQEIAWASHLSVSAVLLEMPTLQSIQLARKVNQVVRSTTYLKFWLRVPLYYPIVETEIDVDSDNITSERHMGDVVPENSTGNKERTEDPWEAWNALRTMCEFHGRIGVALEITGDLPSPDIIQRWLGEPIMAVIIPINVFLTNRKGYPALSPRHQSLVQSLMKLNPKFFFKGRPRHKGRLLPYVQYLEFLYSKLSTSTTRDLFEMPYLDYLQAPLQPLMDNLESQTYETFERDPIKYSQYEKAITEALLDQVPGKEVVVMVVGAGRGPLVSAALRAAELSQRTIRLYAVEKNPNAVITLRNLKISEKWINVEIIAGDMRKWKAPEKADIMISELLGSFGDNELSPECLDGAQSFLKEGGVSIPCNYTSYLSPISTSKLWSQLKDIDTVKGFETPYVVRLHNFFEIAKSQACFKFTHPSEEKGRDNRRYTSVVFQATQGATVHGFAGYFESQLYGEHYISINPSTFSEGMFSWFPIYFPLASPFYVPPGATIEAHFWRQQSESKVWYEWSAALQNQSCTAIHNPNGRSYWIGL